MEGFETAKGMQNFTNLLEGQLWLYLLDDSTDEPPCQDDGRHRQHVEVNEVKVLWGQNQNYSISNRETLKLFSSPHILPRECQAGSQCPKCAKHEFQKQH